MKILCVIDSLGSGGAQRQIVNLAIGFKEKGHYVSFLVYHRLNFFKEILDNAQIEVNTISELNYLKRIIKMRVFIRKGKYDSVLSFLEGANFICELAGFPYRKWKLIVGERSANPEILTSFKLKFLRTFHLFADYIVANSHENINILKKATPFIRKSNYKVIYNIVELHIKEKQSTRKCTINNIDKFSLIVVASHQYLKNLNNLIEAVNILEQNEKEKLLINWYGGLGLDDSKEIGLAKIQDYKLNNQFVFHEPTPMIHLKMAEADAVGLFSLFEGLPNVICEAMNLAKPIIASNVSDIPELLSNDQNCLFNPVVPEEIAKSIKYLLNTSPEKLNDIGIKNKKLAKLFFNKESIINEYINLMFPLTK